MLLLFVLMGAFAGFTSARLYKTFRGKQWQRCTLLTATLFPGLVFLVFFVLDVVVWFYGSTGTLIVGATVYGHMRILALSALLITISLLSLSLIL
jgi:transmembrane 9 superfamily member 2/4